MGRVGAVERAAIAAAKSQVGEGCAGLSRQNLLGLCKTVEYPHPGQARIGHQQAAVFVHRQAVRATGAIGREELPGLGHAAVCQQWHAPDAVAPCDRHKQEALVVGQHDAIGAGYVGEQHVQPSVGCQAVDAACGVVQSGLSLVGEIQVAL